MWVWMAWTAVCLLVAAGAAWWMSRWDFATVRAHVDGLAADGEVETYTPAFHARVMANLRWLAAAATGVAAVLLAFASRRSSRSAPAHAGAWAAFQADLREGVGKLRKRTSGSHKQVVWLLVMAGALLRAWQLRAPITYDEAFTYVYYAVRPLHVIISDYSYPNNQILHTLLVKLSTALFGVGLWQVRLPALLAGIAAMPLFYIFVRLHFNRYIALLALALVASSGGLIEYSALARGYSLTWCFLVLGWILGRHFMHSNNAVSAVLLGVVNALGTWTIPTMLYGTVALFVWLVLSMALRYDSTLARRMGRLLLAAAIFLLTTFLLYLPVGIVHGFAQLVHHPTMGDNTWETFSHTHQDRAFDLWAYLNDQATTWFSILGFLALAFSAYISSKYRVLLVSLLAGTVPLVIVQHLVAPPRVWLFILFVLHLGTAIAVFYLLKLVQETVWEKLSKRVRTIITALVLFGALAWTGMHGIQDRIERYPEAALAAELMRDVQGPDDRLLADFPWEAPLEFHLIANGMGRHLMYRRLDPERPGTIYVLVSPADDQTLDGVALHHRVPIDPSSAEVVKEWKRSKIFAARLRTAPTERAPAEQAP